MTAPESVIRTAPDTERNLGWRRLAFLTGIIATLLTGLVSTLLGDVEGVAVTVAFAASTGLLQVRRGTVGAAGLVLVGAVTLYFMGTAAVTNIQSGSDTPAVLTASALAAVSALAVISGIGFLIRREQDAGPGPVVAATMALAGFVTLGVWGAMSGVVATEQGDIQLASENLAFSETELTASSGRVTVVMENKDLFWHTFTIEELDVDLRVPLGAELAVDFEAPPGEYVFICAIPGHPEAGMVGTLTLEG